MKIETEINPKVRCAMRSLHRLLELTKMQASDIIIDNERNLLLKHLNNLNSEEIVFLVINFKVYHQQEKINDELSTNEFFAEFDSYVKNLN